MVDPRKPPVRVPRPPAPVEVLIALDGEADEAQLRRLQDAVALDVRRVIGRTVVATIDPRRLPALRAAHGVRDVEVASMTRLH